MKPPILILILRDISGRLMLADKAEFHDKKPSTPVEQVSPAACLMV